MTSVFGVEKLKSITGGFAKGNRYNVIIPIPAVMSSAGAVTTKLQYLCEAVSLPMKSLASVAHDMYGPPREIPYRETFSESALSFILDDAFTVKKFFDEWQAGIINPTTNNSSYYNDYVVPITITRLSNDATGFETATDKYKIQLIEAYPTIVGEVALGHTQGADVLRLSITLKYRRWNLL